MCICVYSIVKSIKERKRDDAEIKCFYTKKNEKEMSRIHQSSNTALNDQFRMPDAGSLGKPNSSTITPSYDDQASPMIRNNDAFEYSL